MYPPLCKTHRDKWLQEAQFSETVWIPISSHEQQKIKPSTKHNVILRKEKRTAPHPQQGLHCSFWIEEGSEATDLQFFSVKGLLCWMDNGSGPPGTVASSCPYHTTRVPEHCQRSVAFLIHHTDLSLASTIWQVLY